MPTKGKPMLWAPEQVELLEKLWNDGWSAGEIGRKLAKSRSAVIGKLFRLGLIGDMTAEEKSRRISQSRIGLKIRKRLRG